MPGTLSATARMLDRFTRCNDLYTFTGRGFFIEDDSWDF
jgi:hypothetical protein